MQAGVQLESLAQAHFLGQGNHRVAIVALGQLFGQRMGQLSATCRRDSAIAYRPCSEACQTAKLVADFFELEHEL